MRPRYALAWTEAKLRPAYRTCARAHKGENAAMRLVATDRRMRKRALESVKSEYTALS